MYICTYTHMWNNILHIFKFTNLRYLVTGFEQMHVLN